jgi:hemoglobin-like flavoprotein
MNRIARGIGWTIVLPAAFAFSTWSLYVLAHDHFHVPALLAALAGVVYDGAALLALDAWATAARDPHQSTLRPRIAAILLLTTSVYLNITHASMGNQGAAAAVLYAAPSIVLWGMAELRLGAQHAAGRHQIGLGYQPRPAYGIDAWVVRRGRAWKAYTGHIDARLDRALPAAETHDNVQGFPELEGRDAGDALQFSAPHPATLTAAITAAASVIGPDAQAAQIVDLIAKNHRLEIDASYVRTVLSREAKRTTTEGQGGGGYV